MSISNAFKRLGPGLLFAGAAVGVSHLVYSTRAGADFGFGLVWVVLLTNLLKYPFFEFGPRYAIAKGESLLEGYQRLHKGVLWLFVGITLGTMFTVIAAVSLVTASLATHLFGITADLFVWIAVILGSCAALLAVGRYQLLDGLMKTIIIALTLITLVTVVIAWVQTPYTTSWTPQFSFTPTEVAFIIAFMGWMPAPLDLSVWHSLWALEKQKDKTNNFDVKQSLFDFNVGYIGTTFLALFFVALGALVMYNSGASFSDKGAKFASQLINLYTQTLGSGMGAIVGIAAFITMFSTTITCLDALPRSMAKAQLLLQHKSSETAIEKKYYFGWMLILIVGAWIILKLLLVNMGTFIKVATILSFLTAPFFAIANYKLVTNYLPVAQQPSTLVKLLSLLGIVYLVAFGVWYIWILLV